MNVLVVDLAAVEYRLLGDLVEVAVPGVGVVASAPVVDSSGGSDLVEPADLAAGNAHSGLPVREAVFRALDSALDRGRVPMGRSWARIAFYNPLSAEVAVDAVPRTIAFASRTPLALPLEGALGVVADGVLSVAGEELFPRCDDFALVHEAIASHLS